MLSKIHDLHGYSRSLEVMQTSAVISEMIGGVLRMSADLLPRTPCGVSEVVAVSTG